MTLVLGIDTATDVRAGVARDGVALAGDVVPDRRAHAEQLLPLVQRVLAAAGATPPGLTGVVVGVGPGPFTGLRVGVAAAITLAEALGIPVRGVCSLDVVALEGAARGALESADATDDASVAAQLRVYAVVAYGRTFGSNARPDLATFVELSPQDSELTARLKVVRNKYGAHSENDMTTTTPLLDLQKEVGGNISIQQVTGITVDSPMPHSFVTEFAEMLSHIIEQLTAALQPLKSAVRENLTREEVTAVFDDLQPLQIVTVPVAEWEPNARRPAYPASRFSPVHMDTGQETINASITR